VAVIIQRRGSELWLIRQTDHAALAATIMAGWQTGLLAHPRRDTILAATRDHDEGWREEDEAMHTDGSGEPLDFIAVPAAVKQRIWPRATARLARGAPYVAALVAQHALTIFGSLRQDPEWRAFFAMMERERRELLDRAVPHDAESVRDDYPYVRIGDQLSLVFCNGWTAPMSGVGYRARLKDNILEITPDPFDRRRIPLGIEARAVPARTYPTAAALREAYAAAAPVILEGEARGA
jgi:hypothetical protein